MKKPQEANKNMWFWASKHWCVVLRQCLYKSLNYALVVGLSLLCFGNRLLCLLALLQFLPISYAIFYATPQSIMLVVIQKTCLKFDSSHASSCYNHFSGA